MALSRFYYTNGTSSTSADTIITQSSYNRSLDLSTINIGSGVTRIENQAFIFERYLTTVTLPNTLISIGDSAFRNCIILQSVNLGNGVVTIETYAFQSCFKLNNITIPNSTTSIGAYAFAGCSVLGVAIIGDNVTTISAGAFQGCGGLGYVYIGSKVNFIDSFAFSNCGNLDSITIPNRVSFIGTYAFSGCRNLANIIFDGTNLNRIQANTFYYCTNLLTFTVPNGVVYIDESAFSNSGLNNITIPTSVTTIGNTAFQSCVNLSSITIPSSVTSLADNAFLSCSNLNAITIDNNNPNYSNDSYGVLFNKNKTILIQYPIGRTANSYVMPNSVTSITENSFQGSINLTNLSFSTNLSIITDFSFDGSGLIILTLPNNITTIGEASFFNCINLTNVIIGSGLNRIIGIDAFFGCSNLTTFSVDTNNQTYSSDSNGVLFDKNKTLLIIFPRNNPLESYTIISSIRNIAGSAFYGNVNLKNIHIENGITIIDEIAFRDCLGLININIPNTVTSIGTEAFVNCSNLTEITIPSSVNFFGYSAFANCINLIKVNFLGNFPVFSANPFYYTSPDLKIYRYSTKLNWPDNLDGIEILLIDSLIHQGLQTFGFPNTSSGKVSIKKTSTGSGKITAPLQSKYELILTISPTNQVYEIYTNNIDPAGITALTSKNEYLIEIIKEDNTWRLNFRNIINGDYCNTFSTSDNSPEDFRDVDWNTYFYGAGCPNLNYTRLDTVINQRY